MGMEEEIKEGILDSMEEYSEDEDLAYYYDVEHDRVATENGRISIAKKEGRQERNIEIAKSMKQENIDIELISKCTGLTEEVIEKL